MSIDTGSLSYHSADHRCYLNTNYDGDSCNKTSDCQSNLVCDPETNTCRRSYFQACISDSDCESSYVCTNQKCLCVI